MKGELIDPIKGVEIEFKQINTDDFDSKYYSVEKEIIEPNKKGYLADSLKPILDNEFDVKNTVVINAGVGQGKSRTIMDKVLDYSMSKEYIVIIAVPSNNLIEQYETDCLVRGIAPDNIFNIIRINQYDFLKSEKEMTSHVINFFHVDDTDLIRKSNISDFRVHIMTTNALLGNPGENSIFPANKRINYFEKLVDHCNISNKKLIVVFDEIHDAIQNFREEYIFKLWNFQNLINKTFIISATFNEASKEVIKYISEFTDRKIKIIESRRVIIPARQSELNFIFNDYKKINNNTFYNELLERLLNENDVKKRRSFDIIVYSKKQIKQLKKGYLSLVKDRLNLCYKDVFDFENDNNKKYDHEEKVINIGTNFTTGINIEKKNHTYIIILPKRLNIDFVNNRGVFTNGINTIIQTLARQRLPGEIYIIMPTPYYINAKSLPYDSEINTQIVNSFQKYASGKVVNYSDTNKEKKLLNKAYKKLIDLNAKASENIQNTERTGMNTLDYPSKERFILEKGENYLTQKFFDGDLSTYTFFAALNNQFLNCRINKLYRDNKIIFDKGSFFETIQEMYNDYAFDIVPPGVEGEYKEERYAEYYSEFYVWNKLLNMLPSKEFYFEGGKRVATPAEITFIKRYLLMLVIRHGKIDREFTSRELGKELSQAYLKSCIEFSDIPIININSEYYTKTEHNDDYPLPMMTADLLLHYVKWKEYITLVESEIFLYKGKRILPKIPSTNFENKFKKEKFDTQLEKLLTIDPIISADIIPFKDSYSNTTGTKVEFFFNLLVDSFFSKNIKDIQPIINGKREQRHYRDIARMDLSQFYLNLIYDKIPSAIL